MRATSNWLEVHARFRPGAPALVEVASARRWTYAGLHEASLRWAGRLHAEGVGPGDVVAVLAPNRAETLILLFACAEVGATLFPMNWRLADAELRWQLHHAAARLVFVDPEFSGRVPGVVLTEEPGAAPWSGPGSRLDGAWVLMYTSGSTGRPKGALLTHQQLHWNAVNTQLACDLEAADSTLTFTPLFHTGGLNCLTTPLFWRGGRVVLARGFEAGESLRVIAEERVSLLMGVPTIFQMMADHPAFDGADLTCVRDALVGGAALPLPLLARYRARQIPLRQGFGLTEVGPNCFSLPPADIERKWGAVGMVIPHMAAKLVRPDGRECAAGEEGELLLSGPAVFGGYLHDDRATQAALVEGWFHTGDVLCQDDEGYFYVRGRIKDMFISGGENVYPPEVEAAIAELPGVAQVAVVGVPDVRWGEVGFAWVQASTGGGLSADTVRGQLGERLARFKIPKHVRVVPELPVTASGKLDRVALRARAEAELSP